MKISSIGTNKFKLIELFLFLKWFADKKSHSILEQQILHYTKYKKNILDLLHYCVVESKLISACGKNFFKLPFHKRKLILTDKGDNFYRDLAIYFGGDNRYFLYYDRDPNNLTFNKEIREKTVFKGIDGFGNIIKSVEGYTIN